MPHQWFNIAARAGGSGEIAIFDEITAIGGVSAKDFDRELKSLGTVRSLLIRINSPGGDTVQAAAIYNMLERLKASGTHITVLIEGIAASAASWIAMVGDEVVMPANTLMMIHDPSGLVIGGADDMRGLAGVLDRIRDNMAAAYARKSGKSLEEVKAIMRSETYFSAEEAVAAGFADRVDQPIAIAAHYDAALARIAKRPMDGAKTMDALADAYWTARGRHAQAASSETLDELAKRLWARDGNLVYAAFGNRSPQG